MAVEVQLPGALREHAGGARSVAVEGAATVGDVFDQIGSSHPALARRIRDEQGALRRHVNVYVGDVDVRDADGLATAVRDGDVVLVLPSIAGG
jgi:molybdopterin converting factor small subunit